MDKKELFNNIMETVSKQVKQSLNEVDDIQPKRAEVAGNTYMIFCSGIDKKVAEQLSTKLGQFDDYTNGSIRILCKTHEEVNKSVAVLINCGALDTESFFLHGPKIQITKIDKTSVNDSVNEEAINEEKGGRLIAHSYIPMNNIKVPRQRAKLDIIMKINSGELERSADSVRNAMMETGLWNDRTAGQIEMDVNLIMRKTDKFLNAKNDVDVSGDFVTDFTYSKDNYEPGEFASGMDAAQNHVKYLVRKGLDVEVKEGRYSYKIYIHYNNKEQYEILVRWLAWHCGITDTQNNPCPRSERAYIEDLIKSGKKTTW